MPIVSKKIKAIHKDILIKNQITTLLNKSNTSNTSNTPQTIQQSTANSNYYVSLYQNDNKDLSFNTTSNSLITKNLVIQNPPSCYLDASNSYDLVKKSHMNKYVGFDLSQEDRFYSEDWITGITKGSFNWDLSADNQNITTEISMVTSITNSQGDVTLGINNVGILRLYSRNTVGYKTVSLPIRYNTAKLKKMSFVVTFSNGRNLDFRIGFFDNKLATSSSNNIGFKLLSNGTNGLIDIDTLNSGSSNNISSSISVATKWMLLEIQKNNNNLVFSVKNLTDNIILGTVNTTRSSDFDGYISMFFYANTTTANNRYVFIDYLDWVVSP
jgi:hypothetical protein